MNEYDGGGEAEGLGEVRTQPQEAGLPRPVGGAAEAGGGGGDRCGLLAQRGDEVSPHGEQPRQVAAE